MPLPTSINDLSTTVASNSPAGSENPQTFDDYLRWHASFIAALRDVVLSGTANLSTANLTYTGTLTGSTGILNIGSGQIYKDGSGNVGIGTSTMSAKFDVVSAAAAIGRFHTPNANGGYVDFFNGSVSLGLLGFGSTTAGTAANTDMVLRATNNLIVAAGGGTERMRIDSNGNVAIANTSSAPAAPASGGILYVQAGALKYIGSSGTIKTIAEA